jgi:hypothetical protein
MALRIDTYNGYLTPYLPQIRSLHEQGLSPREIARVINVQNQWGGSVDQMIAYLFKDPDALPMGAKLSLVEKHKRRNALRDQRLARKFSWERPERARPLDMGGPRNVWQRWDAVKQYLEFSPRDWLIV